MIIMKNNPLIFTYVETERGSYNKVSTIQEAKTQVLTGLNNTHNWTYGKLTNVVEHKDIDNYYFVNQGEQTIFLKNVQVCVENIGWRSLDTTLINKKVLGIIDGKYEYTNLFSIELVDDEPATGLQLTIENNYGFFISISPPIDSPMILIREQ